MVEDETSRTRPARLPSLRTGAFELSPVAAITTTSGGVITAVNDSFIRLAAAVEGDSFVGLEVLDLIAPQDRHLAQMEVAARDQGRRHGRFTCRLLARDGGQRWARLVWHLVQDPGEPVCCLTFVEDVEAEARAALVSDELLAAVESERAVLDAALEASPDGLSLLHALRDPAGEVVDALLVRISRTGAAGRRPEELTGRPLRDYFPEAEETGLHDTVLRAFRTQQTQRVLVEVGPDGSWPGSFENVVVPIDVDRVLCMFRDVTRERLDEQRLLHAATHDALTGLPNRVLLRDRIEHALQRVHRDGGALAVAFLDLDGFKSVNDTRGHTFGDEVLRRVAERLSGSVRDGDTVARLGGDEFVLVLEGCADLEDWEHVHRRVTRALADALEIDGRAVSLRASVGVVLAEAGETDADAVMRDADIAMYVSKGDGKARYTVFTEDHRRAVLDQVTLEEDLARAVQHGQFELHHQPIHDVHQGRDVGHEVLLRWRHPVRGLLLPASFLPSLEASGHMVQVGAWLVREALRQAGQLDPVDGFVTVNVSAQQLVGSDFVATVRDALEQSDTPSPTLVVEITESQLLPSRSRVLDQLRELRVMGVRVAVDDFGTGFSSLSHLAELPVDLVKIDGRFLVGVGDPRREAVLRSAVELSAAVGADCLVEGVETQAQLDLVRAIGARFAQGFLLGRPEPVRAATD